jgi:hypothetical protein
MCCLLRYFRWSHSRKSTKACNNNAQNNISSVAIITHVTKITDAISNADYDSPYVTCAISLPIALQIRAHSIEMYLNEKLSNFDNSKVNI